MTEDPPAAAGPARWRRLAAALRSGVGALVDVVLPPRCPRCRDILAEDGGFCGPCLSALTLIGEPKCDACALPFPTRPAPADAGGRLLCGRCLAAPLAFGRCRAALLYDDASRPLILAMKHGDRTLLDVAFAGLMARAGRDLLAEGVVVVPVPLHTRRLRARRYNQSALLAQRLVRRAGPGSGLEAGLDWLARTRATRSQGGLGRDRRFDNVAGAFAVPPQRMAGLRGRRILLVDDVMTTGATLDAAARSLLRAGAAGVDALVVARVPAEA